MKRLIILAMCALTGPALIPEDADAQRAVRQVRPKNLDFESVTIDAVSETKITDLANVSEVQVHNDTNQDVCIAVDATSPFNCASVTITCTGGANHTVVKVGAAKSWPMPLGHVLCAKAAGAVTGKFYVEERDE